MHTRGAGSRRAPQHPRARVPAERSGAARSRAALRGRGSSPCPAWGCRRPPSPTPPLSICLPPTFIFIFLLPPLFLHPPRTLGRAHPRRARPGPFPSPFLFPFPFSLFPSPKRPAAGPRPGTGLCAGRMVVCGVGARMWEGASHHHLYFWERKVDRVSLPGGGSGNGAAGGGKRKTTIPQTSSYLPINVFAPSPPLPPRSPHLSSPSPQPASHKVCDVADNAQGFSYPPPLFFF